jgi:hypothetical protein
MSHYHHLDQLSDKLESAIKAMTDVKVIDYTITVEVDMQPLSPLYPDGFKSRGAYATAVLSILHKRGPYRQLMAYAPSREEWVAIPTVRLPIAKDPDSQVPELARTPQGLNYWLIPPDEDKL